MSNLCTFTETRHRYVVQDVFHCYTCNLTKSNNKGMCTKCSQTCHSGHDVRYFMKTSFFCDCGAGDALGPCKALLPNDVTDEQCCTFKVSGARYIKQDMYKCTTCSLAGSEGCCKVCAVTCHRGHNVEFVKTAEQFYCDCPSRGGCIAMESRVHRHGMPIQGSGYPHQYAPSQVYPSGNQSYSHQHYQPTHQSYPPTNEYPPRDQYPPSNPSFMHQGSVQRNYPPSNPQLSQYPPTNPPRNQYPPTSQYPPTNPPRNHYPPTSQSMQRNYPPMTPQISQYPPTTPPHMNNMPGSQTPSNPFTHHRSSMPSNYAPTSQPGNSNFSFTGSISLNLSSTQYDFKSILNTVKKSWKRDQVSTLQSQLNSHIFLTPAECGTLVKTVWKENQLQVALILRNHCRDFGSFREQMRSNMWASEFSKTGF